MDVEAALEDIRSLLSMYRARSGKDTVQAPEKATSPESPTTSEIPDVFFDEILPHVKLTRYEVMVLMVLYRQVYCRPNLYRSHGIGPLNSYQDLARAMNITQEELIHAIRSLEEHAFIQTIRAGQYFVRKFFTELNDLKYGQQYEF